MSGYGQFCAVARALDVLGERWTLLVVRELMLGAASFSDIRRGLPRIPRATLSTRLRTLRAVGIVEDYRLTEAGAALAPVVQELARWAVTTESAALGEEGLDTAALTWDMQWRVDTDALLLIATQDKDVEHGCATRDDDASFTGPGRLIFEVLGGTVTMTRRLASH